MVSSRYFLMHVSQVIMLHTFSVLSASVSVFMKLEGKEQLSSLEA